MLTEPNFLAATSIRIMEQLAGLAGGLSGQQYCNALDLLGGSSIGKHYRHIIECIQCLQNSKGMVNYDARPRNTEIENNKHLAVETIEGVIAMLKNTGNHDRELVYKADFSATGNEEITATTSYFRELAYNIEHAVHHMAIIQMAVKHYYPGIKLEKDFGVAASTLRYRQAICAQ